MATTLIDLEAVTVAIEYHDDDAMRLLVKPDPEHMAIKFTLHIEGNSAFFDISIPFRYKTKTDTRGTIHVRIDPRSIISLDFSTKTDLPNEVKGLFDSAEYLEF
ncbi:unnamed protein product [Fusarium graminearum]|nr:unnamed protein product [Fusarium graminearum]